MWTGRTAEWSTPCGNDRESDAMARRGKWARLPVWTRDEKRAIDRQRSHNRWKLKRVAARWGEDDIEVEDYSGLDDK